ncbi:MAG TPA: hypothetical protein GXZ66_01675 [Clostridiaceae bacterium]|jgi:hypothetical protein|nr:hypothetical protein [Clostridiaceae bacterium]HOA30647.1 NPCBM/NEW2 domain-containing protein [Clostridia bacterium]
MKKVIFIVITLFLAASLLSVLAEETENEDGLYLTKIEYVSATGYVTPIFDIEGTIRHDNEDFKYPHSIEAHPISVSEPSEIVYDISEYNYTHFAAYLGKNAVLEARGAHVVFVVWADGEKIYESETVAVGDLPVACVAKIPEGTKELKLEVNAGIDGVDYDTSTWGSPMLVNLEVTDFKEKRQVSKTEYKVGEEFSPNGGFYTIVYSNGMEVDGMLTEDMISGFDSETPGAKTITVTYEEKTYTFEVTVLEDETPAPTQSQKETKEPTDESEKDGGNLGIIIAVVVATAVVVAVVVAIIVLRKKQ